MECNEVKKIFNKIAKVNGFEKAFEGWFKEFPGVIFVLDLQKSNFGNYFYLNVKLFIQGVFENKYEKSKKLVKTEEGDIFLRQPDQYSKFLDLDSMLSNTDRENGLLEMFENFISPLVARTNTREGIKSLYKKGNLFILQSVKNELGI